MLQIALCSIPLAVLVSIVILCKQKKKETIINTPLPVSKKHFLDKYYCQLIISNDKSDNVETHYTTPWFNSSKRDDDLISLQTYHTIPILIP